MQIFFVSRATLDCIIILPFSARLPSVIWSSFRLKSNWVRTERMWLNWISLQCLLVTHDKINTTFMRYFCSLLKTVTHIQWLFIPCALDVTRLQYLLNCATKTRFDFCAGVFTSLLIAAKSGVGSWIRCASARRIWKSWSRYTEMTCSTGDDRALSLLTLDRTRRARFAVIFGAENVSLPLRPCYMYFCIDLYVMLLG